MVYQRLLQKVLIHSLKSMKRSLQQFIHNIKFVTRGKFRNENHT